MAGGEFAPGTIALVTPDGSARQVADGVAFPNGMAVTPDNSTLIVAESYGRKLTAFDIAADGGLSNRRVWADLGDGVPDGICLDAENAVWYGDVPNKRCVRVREGGEVLQTINLDRGCFACMLGGTEQDVVPDGDRVAWHGEHPRSRASAHGTSADHRGPRTRCRVAGAMIRCDLRTGSANRRFQFQKRSQLFICMHNEAFSVVAMCVNDPERSPF